jgi:hypothetical protein
MLQTPMKSLSFEPETESQSAVIMLNHFTALTA